jgi:hypothetical protein
MDIKHLIYKDFETWWEEFTGYHEFDREQPKTRGEYFVDQFGEEIKDALMRVWALGWISAENTADGHAAEAFKDMRSAGFCEAVDSVQEQTFRQGRMIINHNIVSMALSHGLGSEETPMEKQG